MKHILIVIITAFISIAIHAQNPTLNEEMNLRYKAAMYISDNDSSLSQKAIELWKTEASIDLDSTIVDATKLKGDARIERALNWAMKALVDADIKQYNAVTLSNNKNTFDPSKIKRGTRVTVTHWYGARKVKVTIEEGYNKTELTFGKSNTTVSNGTEYWNGSFSSWVHYMKDQGFKYTDSSDMETSARVNGTVTAYNNQLNISAQETTDTGYIAVFKKL